MEDNDNVVVDPVNDADTQQDDIVTPPTDDASGHGEEDKGASQAVQDEPQDPKLLEANRREEGKLKQYQEALQKAGISDLSELETLAETRKSYEAIQERAKKSPESWKKALIEYNDMTEAEADQAIVNLKANGWWKESQTQLPTTGTTPVNPEVLAEQIEQRLEQKHLQKSIMKSLEETYPELVTNDPIDYKTNKENIAKADYLAKAMMQALPNVTYKDAVFEMYAKVTGKSADEVNQARENGKLEGLALATQKAGASSGAPAGQQANKPSVNLSDFEREAAKKMKMTEEEYVKYGSSKETYAE